MKASDFSGVVAMAPSCPLISPALFRFGAYPYAPQAPHCAACRCFTALSSARPCHGPCRGPCHGPCPVPLQPGQLRKMKWRSLRPTDPLGDESRCVRRRRNRDVTSPEQWCDGRERRERKARLEGPTPRQFSLIPTFLHVQSRSSLETATASEKRESCELSPIAI